jgi:predicted RNase H-like HicB family nuclease
MKLLISISQLSNGRFRASCPSLPGCCATGLSREEVTRNMNSAVRDYLASINDAVLPEHVHLIEPMTAGAGA